jgi:UDP-glucose 4-epimerase
MLILVTGATGRIGHQITRALVKRGHHVRALAGEDHPRAGLIAGPQVEFCPGRILDVEAVNAAARGVDAVFHLAAGLGSRGNTEEEIFDMGLRGTFNLLRAVRDYAPNLQRFLYASSDAVYWSASSLAACYLPIDEAHPKVAGSVYGGVKIGCEEMCLTFMRAFGVPVTNLRFGATANAAEVVSPTSRFSLWLFLQPAIKPLAARTNLSPEEAESLAILRGLDDGTEKLMIQARVDGTPEVRMWGDARDVAEGCVLAMESPAALGETFNLGGKAPFTTEEQITYLSRKTGIPYVTARIPIVRSPWYISSAKARGLIGYEPRYSIFDMMDEGLSVAT